MSEVLSPDDNSSKTGLGIDRVGWKKVGKGALIAGAGALLGGATGPQVVTIAIEQGWLDPSLPTTKPETYGFFVAASSFLWSVLTQMAYKCLGRFPVPREGSE